VVRCMSAEAGERSAAKMARKSQDEAR